MADVVFHTKEGEKVELKEARVGRKLLALALKNKIEINYGCAACRCGTCAVRLLSGKASSMDEEEKKLLTKMDILDGERIRLSCKAKLTEESLEIDMKFQNDYDPSAHGFD